MEVLFLEQDFRNKFCNYVYNTTHLESHRMEVEFEGDNNWNVILKLFDGGDIIYQYITIIPSFGGDYKKVLRLIKKQIVKTQDSFTKKLLNIKSHMVNGKNASYTTVYVLFVEHYPRDIITREQLKEIFKYELIHLVFKDDIIPRVFHTPDIEEEEIVFSGCVIDTNEL